MTTGQKIYEIRRKRRPALSQERLAHKAGIARNTLVLIEAGDTVNAKQETLQAIADALSVPLSDIIGTDHVIFKVAEKIAEERAEYRSPKDKTTVPYHQPKDAAPGNDPRMARDKRRAG